MEITVGLYKTRCGDKATIYRTDAPGTCYPVVGTIWKTKRGVPLKNGVQTRWTGDGQHSTIAPTKWDLVERIPCSANAEITT